MHALFKLPVLALGLCLLALQQPLSAQDYQVAPIGFYNLENLFDTLDTPDKRDEEFTPTGRNKYNTEVYQSKMNNLSKVISEMATDITPDGVVILGVSEIENRKVLEDLVQQPKIKDRNYKIIHEESPDARGIDVALLYNPRYFRELSHKTLAVNFPRNEGDGTYHSRDILWVEGILGGTDTMHIFVNHWPSRRGGEKRSSPRREHAAKQCKAVIDSLIKINPNTKIFITGDLNDDPVSPSVKNVLQAKGKKKEVQTGGLFNPMWKKYKKGNGTLAWNDSWNLFDQTIISSAFLNKKQKGFFFQKAVVFRKGYLFQKEGRFKNAPKRTYSFGTFIGGYSDHLPVYSVFLRRVQR